MEQNRVMYIFKVGSPCISTKNQHDYLNGSINVDVEISIAYRQKVHCFCKSYAPSSYMDQFTIPLCIWVNTLVFFAYIDIDINVPS